MTNRQGVAAGMALVLCGFATGSMASADVASTPFYSDAVKAATPNLAMRIIRPLSGSYAEWIAATAAAVTAAVAVAAAVDSSSSSSSSSSSGSVHMQPDQRTVNLDHAKYAAVANASFDK